MSAARQRLLQRRGSMRFSFTHNGRLYHATVHSISGPLGAVLDALSTQEKSND
jgi:hypothetical protein